MKAMNMGRFSMQRLTCVVFSLIVWSSILGSASHAQDPSGKFKGVVVQGRYTRYLLTLNLNGDSAGYAVKGAVVAQTDDYPHYYSRYTYKVRGLYLASTNYLVAHITGKRGKRRVRDTATGYYDASLDAFIITIDSLVFHCSRKGTVRPAPTPTPEPTPSYQYGIYLLTNASNGLFIGSWQDLYHRLRCGFEGGGINCGDTDYVTYQLLDGPFYTRGEAELAFCWDITAKQYWPLGIGLKAQWKGSDQWYGMWDSSVASLCPNIPTT